MIDRLTSGAVLATDAATGSRTALLNLYHLHWNPDLLAAFGLDVALLPEIRPTAGDSVSSGIRTSAPRRRFVRLRDLFARQ